MSFYLARRESEGLPSDETTLVVDIVDVASNHLIWRSLESDMSGSATFAARFAGRRAYGWKEIPVRPGEVPLYAQVDRKVRATIEAARRRGRAAGHCSAADGAGLRPWPGPRRRHQPSPWLPSLWLARLR